jgi:aspartate/methionine/tyrosine aminotransferase
VISPSSRGAVAERGRWVEDASGPDPAGVGRRAEEVAMRIEPFFVEQWMNAHETTATWNIAETCVDSLTLGELLELSGDADGVLRRLRETRLGYGDITGSPELRAAIAALYGERITAESVLTANGAIGANFLALYALVEPGTNVVSVQPTYQQLFSVPASLGAEVRCLRLREEDGYMPDLGELDSLVDAGTGLIVLNNPNNPTGALMDEALLGEIVAIACEHDAWLFCDEVYRKLEHVPGTTAPSVADLYEKGVSSGSMSKSYSLAGLRTGWVAGPAAVIQRCLDVRDYTTISGGVLDDALATVALEHIDAVLERSLEIVRGNLAIVDEWVESESRLRCVRPRAGTTALIHYGYAVPSVDFCQDLFDETGAFVMPGIAFGEEHSFRLGYACARDVLVGGLEAVSGYLRGLEA